MVLDARPSKASSSQAIPARTLTVSSPSVARSLLILGCSQRKNPAPGLLPAIDRYDGQFYRVLKKFVRHSPCCNLDVVIISAKFGFIHATTPIPDYDQRMTEERASEIAANVIAAFRHWFSEHSYDSIFVNMGRVYEATVTSIQQLKGAIWASGSIGKRASQMKAWLGEGCPRAHHD